MTYIVGTQNHIGEHYQQAASLDEAVSQIEDLLVDGFSKGEIMVFKATRLGFTTEMTAKVSIADVE